MNPSVFSRRDTSAGSGRRGNTLVLVTAILVLLVIIATAYISRTQGGRVVAAAQRKVIDRDDRSRAAVGVVADAIADSLFPRLVDSSDPAVAAGLAATSSTARLKVPRWNGQRLDRYMVDPQLQPNGALVAPYNVAPYETRPWTNWPDSLGPSVPLGEGAVNGAVYDASGLAIGDDNPIGNPGYGDSRWLRSTEPERAYDTLGQLGFDNTTGQQGFTHWSHLSWPATAENGWRVCYDLSNVASVDSGGFTITATAANLFASGAANDYLLLPQAVALQTPYEQWLPGVTPLPFAGGGNFIQRRDNWFGSPNQHFGVLYGANAMPNFIRLNDLGPKRHRFTDGTDRNIVERTLADADGDGFTDSFWFLLPGSSEDGVRQVAAVSVVDNASMVDVNVATRFDRWDTAGHTPADVALTSRLVLPGAQLTNFGDADAVYDGFDTWTGLFSDPQNETPANLLWGLDYPYDARFQVQPRTSGGPETLRTGFDPRRFGDSTSVAASWLRQTGVLIQDPDSTGSGSLELPFGSPLVTYGSDSPARASFDRRRYFQRRQNEGGLFVLRDAQGFPAGIGRVPPRGFTDADELELRMFAGSNYGPVVSALERTVNEPWNYEANFLRSSLARSESVENFLDYYDGNPNTGWPPQQGIAIGDQLSALELLRDNRHRITTYSATRNDIRPLHLRQTVGYDASWDYAFGRLFSNSVSNPAVLEEFSGKAYQRSLQKLDLRSPLHTPLDDYEAALYGSTENGLPDGAPAFVGPYRVLEDSGIDPNQIYEGLFPGLLDDPDDGPNFRTLVALDRAHRFRESFQHLVTRTTMASQQAADGTVLFQSYLGSNYENPAANLTELYRTHLLAASWAANVDTYRDNEAVAVTAYNLTQNPLGATEPWGVDAPIYPPFAPRVDPSIEAEQAFPPQLKGLVFPGMEKQPFLMEAFFCTVYPPSKGITDGGGNIYDDLARDEDYLAALQEQFGIFGPAQVDDFLREYREEGKIPPLFTGSGDRWVDKSSQPAVVFAIQLANPFESPVPLHDIHIRIGNSTRNQCLNLGRLPSPHPRSRDGDTDPASGQERNQPYYFPSELYLGPTLPDAPRTAVVFGIIPPGNNVADFEDAFGVPYEEFHRKWMDFMDIEPGALFGWDADLGMSEHQTLVFDASPTTYARQSPGASGLAYAPTVPPLIGFTPARWFGTNGGETAVDQSVELLRFMVSPRPSLTPGLATCMYAIDRLDNYAEGGYPFNNGGSHGGGATQSDPGHQFRDTMAFLSSEDYAPTMDPGFCVRNTNFDWAGVPLEGGDFVSTWVRAGRAWGWDVNRNGVYDMTEVSPRYVFSEIPEKDASEDQAPRTYEAVWISGGGTGACVPREGKLKARIIDWEDDPDDPDQSWFMRSYLSPLAINPTGTGNGGYEWDFGLIRAKPIRLSTATALRPGSGSFTVDYDAGFPVKADGTVRTGQDPVGWPGKAASAYRWVLMDKGQHPSTGNESTSGVRSGAPVGADGDGNGVDDGLEAYDRIWIEKDRWAYPLQMLQKDADYEQIGEIANVFLWGHALGNAATSFQGVGLVPTFLTFGEIMNNDTPTALLPVVRYHVGDPFAPQSGSQPLRNLDTGVPNASRIRTNRFHVDPGRLDAAPDAKVVRFSPFTPSLEIARFSEPWRPALPAGLSIFDGLVCDGPGAGCRPDIDGDGILSPLELLAIDDFRYGNAAGYSDRPTRGLINVNTAPVEVLRTLPHMSRLVYNDRPWPGTTASGGTWGGYAPSGPLAGDVDDRARPRPISTRNIQYNRIPEAIHRYRRGAGVFSGGGVEAHLVEPIRSLPYSSSAAVPYYDDRGALAPPPGNGAPEVAAWVPDSAGIQYPNLPGTPGLFPGMRRGAGIVGIGELLVMDRVGVPVQDEQSWPQRSVSISGAARNPYGYQADLGVGLGFTVGSSGQPWDPTDPSAENNLRLGLGWRPLVDLSSGSPSDYSNQTDARLSVDRNHVTWRQGSTPDGPLSVMIPDHVAGDAEEANLLFAGISNLISVRSDVFTVHLLVRSFKQNPITGTWNAVDPEYIVDESRYVFVVDRSRCEVAGDQPEIRLLSRIPN